MPDKKHIALILGASGLIGKETLILLLNNNKYTRIYAVSRKPLGIHHSKLTEVIADSSNIEDAIKDIQVDHFFSCIGTTKAKTPELNQYYAIDLDYPLKVAKLLHANGCDTMCLVSSIGANTSASNSYLQLKGKVEEAMKTVGFNSLHIFRPSLLLGKREEYRFLEHVGQIIYPIIGKLFFGKLKDYKGIQGKTVASAMINVASSIITGTYIYPTQLIKELA